MLIEDKHGNQFLEVIALGEDQLSSLDPVTHAVVVARHRGRHLLVFSRAKQHWELPGGHIDPGETPRAAAARELYEESGVSSAADALRFVVAMTFRFQPDKHSNVPRIEHGALYVMDVERLEPFVPNDEIAEVSWWDGASAIGEISALDRKILELVEGTRAGA